MENPKTRKGKIKKTPTSFPRTDNPPDEKDRG